MLLTQMIIVSPLISDDHLTVGTGVTLRGQVLSLNVVSDIGGLGLVATGETLPLASAKTAHE